MPKAFLLDKLCKIILKLSKCSSAYIGDNCPIRQQNLFLSNFLFWYPGNNLTMKKVRYECVEILLSSDTQGWRCAFVLEVEHAYLLNK